MTPDGKLHICERINFTIPIGDVWAGYDVPRIVELWNQYAEILDEPHCRSCWAFSLCPVCFNHVLGDGELDPSLKQPQCPAIREATLSDLQNFCLPLELNPQAFDYMDRISYS